MSRLIRSYIRGVIQEVYNADNIKSLTNMLEVIATRYAYHNIIGKNENMYRFMVSEMMYSLEKSGYKKIGEGATRTVYSRDADPYVIKLNTAGRHSNANLDELDIATGKHGLQSREFVPHVISKDDHFPDSPAWIIVEKVLPLKDMSASLYSKIFPTFHKLFPNKELGGIVYTLTSMFSQMDDVPESDSFAFTSTQDFIEFFCDIVEGTYNVNEYNESYLNKLRENNIIPLDLKRFLSCMKYIYTADLHDENIGIRISSNPSPNDIVVLDFDTSVG